MKKGVTALILAVTLIISIAGCGGDNSTGGSTLSPDSEQSNTSSESSLKGSNLSEQEIGVFDENYSFDSYYAKTPDYFFAVNGNTLERVLFTNLDEKLEIDIKSLIKNSDETHGIYISGITSKWIFISVQVNSDYYFYKISLDGKEHFELGKSRYAMVWYNSLSNSLYYLTQKAENENLSIEAINLENDAKSIIFDDTKKLNEKWIYCWCNTKDGKVALEEVINDSAEDSNYILIDKNNKALSAKYEDVKFNHEISQSAIEMELKKDENIISAAECGKYVYYLENDVQNINLYRMKNDKTEKTLLRPKTHLTRLISINNKLFGLAVYDWGDMGGDILLHSLDADGKPTATIASIYGDSEDSSVGVKIFHSKLLLTRYIIYGGKSFIALYDPVSKKLYPDNANKSESSSATPSNGSSAPSGSGDTAVGKAEIQLFLQKLFEINLAGFDLNNLSDSDTFNKCMSIMVLNKEYSKEGDEFFFARDKINEYARMYCQKKNFSFIRNDSQFRYDADKKGFLSTLEFGILDEGPICTRTIEVTDAKIVNGKIEVSCVFKKVYKDAEEAFNNETIDYKIILEKDNSTYSILSVNKL